MMDQNREQKRLNKEANMLFFAKIRWKVWNDKILNQDETIKPNTLDKTKKLEAFQKQR